MYQQNEKKIFMANFKNNAEMVNGMFNAAQLKNETIIINNGTITFYHRVYTEHGKEWLSFNVEDAHDLGEVVRIMHDEPNGIDLFVDGVFIGYFKWSNNFADRYVGWKLFTDNGDKIAERECGMKRYSENAKYTVAVYMYDYIKENYIDPVDAAVAAWGEKNPEKYNTIEYNTENEYFNVWVGEFFFQMDDKLTGDWATDYYNVRRYLEKTLERGLGSCLEGGEIEYNESWDEALTVAENYMTLSDAWDLGFTVETFLGEWAENNIDRILSDDWRNFGDPSPFRVPVELDGESAKYDYPVDDFRSDVRYYINTIVEKTLKNPDRYASIIADYLYDTWNENFSIFFTGRYRYDEYEGAIYDDEHHEPTEEEKRRAADIAEYCREYGYNFAAVCLEYHYTDYDTDTDTVTFPTINEYPDGFYDAFGEDAMWDNDAMYMGMADYLNEGDEHRWGVGCDGYCVYAYTIDTDPSENTIAAA